MRFAVTFELADTEAVMVFTVEDMEAAYQFVSDLVTIYGHTGVSDPQLYSGNVSDLNKMFPPKRREARVQQLSLRKIFC